MFISTKHYRLYIYQPLCTARRSRSEQLRNTQIHANKINVYHYNQALLAQRRYCSRWKYTFYNAHGINVLIHDDCSH